MHKDLNINNPEISSIDGKLIYNEPYNEDFNKVKTLNIYHYCLKPDTKPILVGLRSKTENFNINEFKKIEVSHERRTII